MLLPYTPLVSLSAAAMDTETTGLDFRSARIVQIAVVQLQGTQLDLANTLDVLVNPGEPIPASASQIHGILDKHVAGQPDFASLFARVAEALLERVIVGYNIEFDLAMLKRECDLAALEWKRPRALDVRFLAHVAFSRLEDDALEAIADRLGIEVTARHTALGDARTAANIYVGLIPLLRQRSVRTLGEAEAAMRDVRARVSRPRGRPANVQIGPSNFEEPPSLDPVFMRLDSYPYRHRIREVMRQPIYADADTPVSQGARLMIDKSISSLIVRTQDEPGIVTERDVLWALANRMNEDPEPTLREIMSCPVQTVHQDEFIYRAIGRMHRMQFRHLGVVDDHGALNGIVSARALLRQRATAAIALGDEIERAPDIEALGLARAKLAAVARSLSHEGIEARAVAAIISAELRALNARAAALAEDWMRARGNGEPPCRYALLILGSAGRGESLLSADQDNALVFEHGEPDGREDRWFAAFGEKLAEILDISGIPYCTGGVMAKNAQWRHSIDGWRTTIDGWLRRSRAQDILEIDIYFDATRVYGDAGLARSVTDYAWDRAAGSTGFLTMLASNARYDLSPFTMFGAIKTDEKGRIDLKRYGLMPIFTGARVLAIRHRIRAMSTPDRLGALKTMEAYSDNDLNALIEAQGALLAAILHQQMADIDAGIATSSRVVYRELPKELRNSVKTALGNVPLINGLVSEGLIG
jgi:CBS domain-containing protein